MDKRTILLTGIPRSGTTLCCHLLNQLPNTIALHEPISSQDLKALPRELAVHAITDFGISARHQALTSRVAKTKQLDGIVPSNPVNFADGPLREEQVSLGNMGITKPLSQDFTLVIKHNALFTALLNNLVQRFDCYAIVRNPLATFASWQTVNLPIHKGHIPMGEQFDMTLQSELGRLETSLDRQLYIMRWFYEKYRRYLGPENIIRYEDIIDSNGNALSPLLDKCIKNKSKLEKQNNKKLYQGLDIKLLMNRLLQEPDIYEGFYGIDDIQILADEMLDL